MTDAQTGYIYGWPGELPPLDDLLARLDALGLLSAGAAWWFGWSEQEIALPRPLVDLAPLAEPWDALHVCAPAAELRLTRRGRAYRAALLTETASGGAGGWVEAERYHAVAGRRLLAGTRLRLPGGEQRGVVAFPRPLDYGVDDPAGPQPTTLVADVVLYEDDAGRLRATRYARLRPVPTGSLQVRPYPAIASR